MKKIAAYAMSLLVFIASCKKDDYETGVRSPDPKQLLERVPGRNVIAYVTHYGTQIPDPAFVTHINYAFAEIYVQGGVYQKFKLQGAEARFQKIVDLKKLNPDLKISISFINAAENADNVKDGGFSAIAKSGADRKKFAQDCKAFLEKWNIDGVDMDWEFPGMSFSGMPFDVAVDVENHVLLMKELRETLGSKYLLTYAGYCLNKQVVTGGYRYIDIQAVDPYVDFVNIMSYDLDESPRHHSALRAPGAYSDCERAVNTYLNAGVAPEKLVLGIPFYGRRAFSGSETAINYNKIILLDRSVYKIDNWDEAASVPYVTKNGQFWCGYDNAKSIGVKAGWMLGKSMKGMMFWDYDGDDSQGTLRRAVWQSVMKK